jgi:hypothetical protein
MANDFSVYWRGNLVGTLCNAIPDMWYLEGKFVSNGTSFAHKFVALSMQLDARTCMLAPEKSTRILLGVSDGVTATETHAVVMSLANGSLFVRQVFAAQAIDWLLQNVS